MSTTTTQVSVSSDNKSDLTRKGTAKGQFSSTMTPSSRQDVLALKQQLADALGENGPLYWDALKDFVAGKLNRSEFNYYANLYLTQEHAHLHNAFILSTVHNAQTATPPPSKHRSVGWAKRKRGKDGGLAGSDQDRDPAKRKLKLDVMSLSKADRDMIRASVKAAGDKARLQPYIEKLVEPRINRVPPLPLPAEQLPPTFNNDYARGLLAPICTDLKELPGPETLHARMTSIALEHGLLGIGDDVVHAMLLATESYLKSAIANAVCKRRVNRSIGLKMEMDTSESRAAAAKQISDNNKSASKNNAKQQPSSSSTTSRPSSPSPDLESSSSTDEESSSLSTSSTSAANSIALRDLQFSLSMSPYVLVERPMNAERLLAILTDSEDEETDDYLGDSGSEDGFDL
ncbi:hypothetical protein VTP01DRAFT_3749 [Rhizomucor pusillus]|uniref:uncharacterized protein n=1 Tax=Rhizomucor pusillus TaxID=4840 RepID=UPI0037448EC6